METPKTTLVRPKARLLAFCRMRARPVGNVVGGTLLSRTLDPTGILGPRPLCPKAATSTTSNSSTPTRFQPNCRNRCPSFVAPCPRSVVRSQSSVVRCQFSAVRCPPFALLREKCPVFLDSPIPSAPTSRQSPNAPARPQGFEHDHLEADDPNRDGGPDPEPPCPSRDG